ncbi:hypothetical protein [uncultured Sphaerochaeta sp.]|uniref:hypothetical protein n=1 Tax=uncultured Sphaerochaeta sp. TaxID=886478 RepID=UPI002A0A7A49|nr:hypothetical protein [uncultured Sphaerochaeta sp.]
MRVHKKILLTIMVLSSLLVPLGSETLSVDTIALLGRMSTSEVFSVVQNQEALNFNLSEHRNTSINVGTYVLISNNSNSLFHLYIKPGEKGSEKQFAFSHDRGEPIDKGKKSELPFTVRVSSNITGGVSVVGNKAMEKELGVRGVYANNEEIVYETGEIIAEIPDFVPDDYSSGWYSSAIQLSIEVN